jgi:hypothetical protein
MAVGGSVVYGTQLRGSGRLIVVGCVQWQLVDRLYMRHNCVVLADSSLLGVCNGSFGTIRLAGLHGWAGLGGSFGASSPRLRPAQRNIENLRLAGLQGWTCLGGGWCRLYMRWDCTWLIGCICDTIAWWWQTHSCWVCAMAVGGSVVYATQLRGSDRLIVVWCVQWQFRGGRV